MALSLYPRKGPRCATVLLQYGAPDNASVTWSSFSLLAPYLPSSVFFSFCIGICKTVTPMITFENTHMRHRK